MLRWQTSETADTPYMAPITCHKLVVTRRIWRDTSYTNWLLCDANYMTKVTDWLLPVRVEWHWPPPLRDTAKTQQNNCVTQITWQKSHKVVVNCKCLKTLTTTITWHNWVSTNWLLRDAYYVTQKHTKLFVTCKCLTTLTTSLVE